MDLENNSNPAQEFGPRCSQFGSNRRKVLEVMQMDRAIVSEFVQDFVRSGEGMRLCLEGVDGLCSEEGALQVLRKSVVV